MAEGGYKIRDQAGMYFLTLTVVGWVDVFTRQVYRDQLLKGIRFHQEERGLSLHGWCLMSNHLHMISTSPSAGMSATLRDLKKYTSRRICDQIRDLAVESRRAWMLPVFSEAGKMNTRNQNYQFWKQDNRPKVIFSPWFAQQKLNYIHQNPVKAGWVRKAEDYLYSSAQDYCVGRNCGLLKIDFI